MVFHFNQFNIHEFVYSCFRLYFQQHPRKNWNRYAPKRMLKSMCHMHLHFTDTLKIESNAIELSLVGKASLLQSEPDDHFLNMLTISSLKMPIPRRRISASRLIIRIKLITRLQSMEDPYRHNYGIVMQLNCVKRRKSIRFVAPACSRFVGFSSEMFISASVSLQNRGWGTEINPELYKKQKDLWEQVSRRSSLSALALATAVHKPITKEEKEAANNKKSSPIKNASAKNVSQIHFIDNKMIEAAIPRVLNFRHHLGRTTGLGMPIESNDSPLM